MGLTHNSARFVLFAQRNGVVFRRAATIGRQQFFLRPEELADLLQRYGFDTGSQGAADLLGEQGGFAEPFLRLLGAGEVRSFDASSYEGATDVHDFNERLPDRYEGCFDLVLDSGSLEHVFDVRTALSNYMRMVDLNGHLIMISPANNWFGHGFYQFSPEFFHRAFSEENGFAVELVAVYEETADPRWYEVPDPKSVGRRLALVNSRPTYLAVLARRIAVVEPLAIAPQESDYADVWSDPSVDVVERTAESGPGPSTIRDHVKRFAEVPVRRLLAFQDQARTRRRMQQLGLQSLDLP